MSLAGKQLLGLALFTAMTTSAAATESLSFMTSWRAQAEHGGYYQAIAKGYYQACGLDLTLRQGGPSVNGQQILAGGGVDMLMVSSNDAAIHANVNGFAARAVMAVFQRNPQAFMVHTDNEKVNSLQDLKGQPVMLPLSSRSSLWPLLKARYGYTDAQLRPYTGLPQWLVDKSAVLHILVTNQPNRVVQETGRMPKVFMFADDGYAAYGSVTIVPQKIIDSKPAAVQCFVDASIKGWKDFFEDPAPAVALIKKDNPDNPDDVIQYAIRAMKTYQIVETDETRRLGIGAMTDARWKADFDALVAEGVVPKEFDYRKVYTLQFVNKRGR